MQDKDTQIDKPLYVNNAIVQYQDTAYLAMYHEVEHLYENAFELIAHTLGFSRADIKSDKDMNEVLKAKIWAKEDIDVEIFYIKKIKVLFNAILDFSTQAQAYTQDKIYVRKFALLTSASRNIVEAIKNVELLQPNLKKNSLSKDLVLSSEYNTLRVHLAMLLRNINEVLLFENIHPQEAIIKLKGQKKVFKKMDKDFVAYIESLLNKKNLSIQNSTSLLNAVGFSNSIAKELVNAIIRMQKARLDGEEEVVTDVQNQ